MVVGGGPAGLEFARTAAMRGHQVELHDAMSVVRWSSSYGLICASQSGFRAITDWLSNELEYLGVEIHLNSFVDEELVAKSIQMKLL